MSEYDVFLSIGVALAAGLLIGFEREQSAPEDETERKRAFTGGSRTYPLVSLSGALCALLVPTLGVWIVIGGFVATVSFTMVNHLDAIRRDTGRGITSEMAFVTTYLLGVVAASPTVVDAVGRRAILVLAVAVAVTLLLSAKPPLHAIAARASKDDVFATLKFLVLAVVVLPLLPNRAIGPLAVLNPFKIGLFVVLIAGVDFVGYVAMRVLGPGRGLGVTGLLGGLVSSTAVTLSVANRAREEKGLLDSFALAAVVASSIMAPRVLLIVALVHRPLTMDLLAPLGAMAVGGAAATFFFYRRSHEAKSKGKQLEIRNPFELGSALKWGLIFTVVLFVSKLAQNELGQRGTYLAALLAGTTDVDAITLSMASLAKEGSLDTRVAATAILIGAGSNSVVKAVMATVIGGAAFGKRIAGALGVMIAAGAAGLAAVWLG